ncbi:Maf family protein [Kiritimatiella glycovorans]|uniref:dTTP/UTP pyrophosphatase n=1 Tax=Kiritimatiella glycovorans TaxID=1307763 RepID=A0A0G3EGE1_9BACT|nr:Maf family protein [Kiritimatiella glycovorans]AKJ65408.1 Septum formation protein Maf [Kiritimatiella glycovorans]
MSEHLAELELVLASGSPRRRRMLKQLGLNFRVAVPAIDEAALAGEGPEAHALRLAAEKARAVAAPGNAVVLAADTVVAHRGDILGKPSGGREAAAMLRRLSGRTHRVITGVCILAGAREQTFSVSTEVEFKTLTAAEIERYVRTGEPMDKAGAYGIQGGAAPMVRAIRGSYTNVVGLPLCEVVEGLEEAQKRDGPRKGTKGFFADFCGGAVRGRGGMEDDKRS